MAKSKPDLLSCTLLEKLPITQKSKFKYGTGLLWEENVTRQSRILVPKESFIHFIYQLLTKEGTIFDHFSTLHIKLTSQLCS